ncbi:MAG: hypothetical protein ACOYMV_14160 [Verrucomicrobiia bacterium]
MRNLLDKLVPFAKGDRIAGNPSFTERLNAMMLSIRALARGENISVGPGATMTSGEGMVVIDAPPSSPLVRGKGGPVPFEVYVFDAEAATVKVRPGLVIWHDKMIEVAESAELMAEEDYHVWLEVDEEWPEDYTTPVVVTASGAAAGWEGFPVQPSPPSRKYLLLAILTVESQGDGVKITVDQKWSGNVTWPGPWAFWQ